MKLTSKALFFTAIIISSVAYADCSYKVINNTSPSFEEQRAIGTVGNLLIPRCSQNPSEDKETKENCATNASNILYEHPHEAGSCRSAQGQFVMLQFADYEKRCKSIHPQSGGNVLLNFPEDFKCNF